MGRTGWIGVALVVVVLGLAREGASQENPPAVQAPQAAWTGDWKAGIEPGQARETLSGEVFVVAAYGALWLFLFLFVLRLLGLNAANRRELVQLREMLERHIQDRPRSGQ
ncbi:hypothetical protein KBD49_01240 [Myxococcota bacterium]|nr:hypothetical protein [Myxococcota bacterium]